MASSPAESLRLGEPYHVGIAVWDLDEAMVRLTKTLGVEQWGTLEADVPSTYRGSESVTGIRSAFARAGALYIELVQPTTGRFTAQTFLDAGGTLGMHVELVSTAMRPIIERSITKAERT